MSKKYTEQELIDELHRFVRENDKIPKAIEMSNKNGYISYQTYANHFGSFNNGVEKAGYEPYQTNEKRTGLETCCVCGNYKKENQRWITKGLAKGNVMCVNCYAKSYRDYMNNNLDKNSEVGFAFISQRVVANVLGLELKYDCNCKYGFKAPIDLYHKDKYKYINVKASHLHSDNSWKFKLTQREIPDTYIMLGFSQDKKDILRVWITDPLDDLTYERKYIGITNNINSGIKRAKPWEVDSKPYNNAYHSMNLNNCSVLRSD